MYSHILFFTWAVYSLTCIAQQGCTFRAREELPSGETLLAISFPLQEKGAPAPEPPPTISTWFEGAVLPAPSISRRQGVQGFLRPARQDKVHKLNRDWLLVGNLAFSQSQLDTISLPGSGLWVWLDKTSKHKHYTRAGEGKETFLFNSMTGSSTHWGHWKLALIANTPAKLNSILRYLRLGFPTQESVMLLSTAQHLPGWASPPHRVKWNTPAVRTGKDAPPETAVTAGGRCCSHWAASGSELWPPTPSGRSCKYQVSGKKRKFLSPCQTAVDLVGQGGVRFQKQLVLVYNNKTPSCTASWYSEEN